MVAQDCNRCVTSDSSQAAAWAWSAKSTSGPARLLAPDLLASTSLTATLHHDNDTSAPHRVLHEIVRPCDLREGNFLSDLKPRPSRVQCIV
jgi:hypothetical protein